MRQLSFIVLYTTILFTSAQCNKESDPQNGHLEVTITYPEVVIKSDTMYWFSVPGVGAEVRLFDKDAECLGYKDARLGRALIGDELAQCKYVANPNTEGKILFEDVEAGEYYLIVYAGQLYKYSEKYIEIIGGDTLKLTKNFTPSGSFFKDLEPWDYVMTAN